MAVASSKRKAPRLGNAIAALPSRDAFERRLGDAIAAYVDGAATLAVALIDIDWFGNVNADHGRAAGDAVLETLAARIADHVDGVGAVFRYGGDAFAILFDAIEKEEAFLRLEALRERLEQTPVDTKDSKPAIRATVSAALAAYPEDANQANALMNKASEALYRAKASGRNRVCLAREEKMQPKTSHYTQGQLHGLRRLAQRQSVGDAVLLREALNDLLRKYNA